MSGYHETAGPQPTSPDDMRAQNDFGAGFPPQALARLLLSGEVGLPLYHALADQFPTIRRIEVFFAIALAWTDLQAGLVAAGAEISDLRRQLGGRQDR